ncbi:MAG: 12,18-didecarboxysiroheme deacetylase [Lentisphaerae bacterium RIFOXYA12_FULL_48_11]|nr:MAG: 12,18-didecarboxysiroheme deacetylase [Lentisphaerae bacterium RIFOXYA12_FULL_48_11]
MIGISKLYLGQVESSDPLRYGRHSGKLPGHLLQFSQDKKPVVVWNVTTRCNLACRHCYAFSDTPAPSPDLSTSEGITLIDDLASFGSPVLLFSGGEPLVRQDLPELAEYAISKGMRAVISTNGTLITDQVAARLKSVGLSYVGISLDGLKEVHDTFRRQKGAFESALRGIRNSREAGIKTGLRFTITRHNTGDIPGIFDLIEKENIPRVCFYHLVYSGRGSNLQAEDLDHIETRRIVDLIIDRTASMYARGLKLEVLTVDNHCDGPYLYMRMQREGNPRAEDVMKLLKMNGGNSTGIGIGCVSWDGTVYPDQFWRNQPLGNVKERPFSKIWTDLSNPLMAGLKDKRNHVTGRCAKCRFLDICGGNFRARAEAVTGEIWGCDPACYLTDKEIGI